MKKRATTIQDRMQEPFIFHGADVFGGRRGEIFVGEMGTRSNGIRYWTQKRFFLVPPQFSPAYVRC